jgi:hypothetical protein
MDLLAGDDRREQGKVLKTLSNTGMEIVTEVFAGLKVSDATLRSVVEARTRIHDQWGRAQTAALMIGKTLLDLSRTLAADEYMAIRRGSERLFPFSDSVATKLRRAAELAEDLRLPLDQAPSYTLLYEISTMPAAGQEIVKARGLLRANVTRAEILAIKSELRQHKIPRPIIEHEPEAGATISAADIEARRNDLLTQRKDMVMKLADLDLQIAGLTEQLRLLRTHAL